MKKAAILFSGLARTYQKTHQHFIKNMVNCNRDWDIDVYIAIQPFSPKNL